jgi:hypothetical protein
MNLAGFTRQNNLIPAAGRKPGQDGLEKKRPRGYNAVSQSNQSIFDCK